MVQSYIRRSNIIDFKEEMIIANSVCPFILVSDNIESAISSKRILPNNSKFDTEYGVVNQRPAKN